MLKCSTFLIFFYGEENRTRGPISIYLSIYPLTLWIIDMDFLFLLNILYDVFDIIFIYGNLLFLLQNLFHFCILQVYFVSVYEVWGDIVLLLEICVLISFQEYLVCSSELNWFWPSLIFFNFLPNEVIFHENITKIICACVFQATLFHHYYSSK